MKLRDIFLLLIVAIGMLLRCSSVSNFAGNTSSETTNGFVAAIIYPNGTPAAHVAVRLRPVDFLADTNSAIAKVLASQKDTLTDDAGRFRIQPLDTGEYLVEAIDESGNAVAIPCKTVDDSVLDLGTQTLRPMGTIAGSIGGPGMRGFVRVRGLERCVQADSAGVFEMNVPAELVYSVNITAADSTADISTIQAVQSSQTTSITVDLETYHSDSLAIRAFLDSMGLNTLLVDSVSIVDTNSNRIRTLNLSRRGLVTIPSSISKLSFLWAIDAGNNPLISLPSTLDQIPLLTSLILDSTSIIALTATISNCANLQWLILGSTGIRDLPPELSQLSMLHTLDLSDDSLISVPSVVFSLPSLISLGLSRNRLTQIPSGLGNLKSLVYLHLDGNQLDSLPQEIGALSHLKVLYAYSNNLVTLPNSISQCDSLQILHLWNNKLTTLPDAIVNLSPTEGLFLTGNHLCSLTSSIAAWADTYAEPNWQSIQTCP